MTRTEMVRLILKKNGRNPPSGLDTGANSEQGLAEEILDATSREVQVSKRWAFADRLEQDIVPDGTTSELYVPTGTLVVQSDAGDKDLDLVQVGEKLYDRKNDTYTFTTTTSVRVSLLYKPECLPMHVRIAVVFKAAAEFAAQRSSVDPSAAGYFQKLDLEANRKMTEAVVRDDAENRNNVLKGSSMGPTTNWTYFGEGVNTADTYWDGYGFYHRT